MLIPDFGPTMNVIAYSPFHDGGSAEAVGKRQGDRERRGAQTDQTIQTVSVHRFLPRCIRHQVSVAEATFLSG
jgi:hypothetical protein